MIGTLLLALLVLLYLFVKRRLNYFKEHGIPHEPGYFPFGSPVTFKAFTGQIAFFAIAEEVYKKYSQYDIVGYYGFLGKPILVIRELEMVKKVMIKDFDHFVNRPFDSDYLHPETNKYFRNNVSIMKDDRWKTMRNIITPIFTSGRIKNTLPLVHEAANDLIMHLQTLEDEESIDGKEEMQKFTAEVFGKLGCGIKPRVFSNDSVFYEKSALLTGGGKPSLKQVFRFMLVMIAPLISYYSKNQILDKEASEFMEKIIRKVIKERKESGQKKNDFIDLLTEAIHEYESGNNKVDTFTQDEIEEIIIGNAMVLFLAGQDTTSNGLSICCLFLAKNQDIQEQLYAEIKEAIGENDHDPNLAYDKLLSLKFLDCVIKESLRLWGVNFFDRVCTKAYEIPSLNFRVPVGMQIQIGGGSIMKDERFFDNPESFDPKSHFPESQRLSPTSLSFMAFGQGPRNCIGMRFAYIMMKTALVHLLSQFRFVPSSKTINEFVIDPFSAVGLPKNGIHFQLQRRRKM